MKENNINAQIPPKEEKVTRKREMKLKFQQKLLILQEK